MVITLKLQQKMIDRKRSLFKRFITDTAKNSQVTVIKKFVNTSKDLIILIFCVHQNMRVRIFSLYENYTRINRICERVMVHILMLSERPSFMLSIIFHDNRENHSF